MGYPGDSNLRVGHYGLTFLDTTPSRNLSFGLAGQQRKKHWEGLGLWTTDWTDFL